MKILIVEDEEKLAKAIKLGLKEFDFEADIVGSGPDAENTIIGHPNDYGLVILDLMLPEKSGFEVCKAVHDSGITIPILIMSARSSLDDKMLAFRNGADDYLTKPFAFSELVLRIQALLQRPWKIRARDQTI